VIRTSIIFV